VEKLFGLRNRFLVKKIVWRKKLEVVILLVFGVFWEKCLAKKNQFFCQKNLFFGEYYWLKNRSFLAKTFGEKIDFCLSK